MTPGLGREPLVLGPRPDRGELVEIAAAVEARFVRRRAFLAAATPGVSEAEVARGPGESGAASSRRDEAPLVPVVEPVLGVLLADPGPEDRAADRTRERIWLSDLSS
jgi:hypothetical protein